MTINIKLKDNLEEVIQYPDVLWQHVILHTKLNQTILGYIPLHWHNDLQLMVVTHGKINIKIAGQNVILKENEGFLSIRISYMKSKIKKRMRHFIVGISGYLMQLIMSILNM